MTGKFITFEGGDGSGKSTQINLLSRYLNARGIPYIVTREPGGTKGGDIIRNAILKKDAYSWNAYSEILLFAASRNENVEHIIKPALNAGRWVLCDRYIDSTRAYQGYGLGYDMELIELVNSKFPKPDVTALFDIEVEKALARSNARLELESSDESRYETKAIEFHKTLRNGFLEIAKADPERMKIINADETVDNVFSQVIDAII